MQQRITLTRTPPDTSRRIGRRRGPTQNRIIRRRNGKRQLRTRKTRRGSPELHRMIQKKWVQSSKLAHLGVQREFDDAHLLARVRVAERVPAMLCGAQET